MEPVPAEIPMPDVLSADRVLLRDGDDLSSADLRERAKWLERALQESCQYGQQLWHQLQSLRDYLIAMLPPAPDGQPLAARRGATPEGPGDDAGWARWMDAYSRVTSSLEGLRGDGGFAAAEAQRIAVERRA